MSTNDGVPAYIPDPPALGRSYWTVKRGMELLPVLAGEYQMTGDFDVTTPQSHSTHTHTLTH